jgi:hypothetical protein
MVKPKKERKKKKKKRMVPRVNWIVTMSIRGCVDFKLPAPHFSESDIKTPHFQCSLKQSLPLCERERSNDWVAVVAALVVKSLGKI